jgi:hypothetical protein
MRYQLPTAATVHIDPQVPCVLYRVGIASYPHNITIRPSYDGSVSEDADVVLFDLKQVERKFPLRHILKECRFRSRGTVRFYMGAVLIDYLIQYVDIGDDEGINATLLNCRHSVFCRLRHDFPLFAAIRRFLGFSSVLAPKMTQNSNEGKGFPHREHPGHSVLVCG